MNRSPSVHPPAVPPDLPVGTRERADVPHPHHGRREVVGERGVVVAVGPDKCVLRAAVEELLVRVEQALLGEQVLEVAVVEAGGGLGVQRREVAVPAGGRAGGPAGGGEVGVDVGVAVDAAAEGGAAGLADGVGAREGGHVPSAEALGREGGDEGGEAGEGGREVAAGGAEARRARV